jgi:hypothetical protein
LGSCLRHVVTSKIVFNLFFFETRRSSPIDSDNKQCVV